MISATVPPARRGVSPGPCHSWIHGFVNPLGHPHPRVGPSRGLPRDLFPIKLFIRFPTSKMIPKRPQNHPKESQLAPTWHPETSKPCKRFERGAKLEKQLFVYTIFPKSRPREPKRDQSDPQRVSLGGPGEGPRTTFWRSGGCLGPGWPPDPPKSASGSDF